MDMENPREFQGVLELGFTVMICEDGQSRSSFTLKDILVFLSVFLSYLHLFV